MNYTKYFTNNQVSASRIIYPFNLRPICFAPSTGNRNSHSNLSAHISALKLGILPLLHGQVRQRCVDL